MGEICVNKIEFKFYIKESINFNEALKNWFNLLEWIKPKTFCFSRPHKGSKEEFKDELIFNFLQDDLNKYEDYLLELKSSDECEYINVNLSPYLKDVAIISCRFKKENYENNKENIFKIIEQAISVDEMMIGYGHPVVYNKYIETGYGHLKLGAHWMMWFGKWSWQYIDNERINSIKENTVNIDINDKYIKAMLTESPWVYDEEETDKKQRKFMKKLKFNEVILEYNKKKEFNHINIEEDPFLEMIEDGIVIIKGD